MSIKIITAIVAILILLGAGYAAARPDNGSFWSGMMGGYKYGSGMMGSYGYGNGMMGGYGSMMKNIETGLWNGMMGIYRGMMGYGSGMMGNYWHGNGMMRNYGYGNGMMGNYGYGSGMMGSYGNGNFWSGMMGVNGSGVTGSYSNGHCGGYGPSSPGTGYGVNATPITIEKAKDAVDQYLLSTGNKDLKLTEVMEFDNHFYAEIKENSTGIHAFELLINKYTGAVYPEMGPNMMWNAKYGHMNWNAQVQATVTEEQALKNAQAYLDKVLPGTKVDKADAFYGYYTIHVLKDSKIYGMLSVNSNTGDVWYHNWHGTFVKMMEVE